MIPATDPHLYERITSAAPTRFTALIREVWGARTLVLMLARKDFLVRYRRATLGLLWAVGIPVLQAVVFAVVFSRVARISAGDHYSVLVFSGIVGWSYFSST